ncbi:MAG: phenylacetate--CoA ligase [Deltaproteobacteria bacterium]|nr:phenylacetate--CoA ligase [Deltaproteobacteria bacterium]MBW1930338.1 phenylacetate--CoA ligase [Deltaproteobacteria bacterium]MBW2025885.1 phenylacetate--CoA ligase [Deltaproteobacteria bacterium]MBW2125256.1 phenylacetate--CoA ligase [Deltaproteobacteria bacterium]
MYVSKSSETPKYYDPEIETMDREQLEELQLKRLKWQVKRCYEFSEFYRERFDNIGLDPEDIKSLDDITKIPPVTKEELRQEQIAHPPFGRYVVAPQKDWRELHPSTGTTGVPVNTIWTEHDVENITQWTVRTMWNCGVRPGDIVQNGFSYGLWVAGMSCHYAAKAMGCFVLPIGASMAERQVDYLISPGSTVLLSTPSFALYIAERMSQRGIRPKDIPLKIGMHGGEAGAEVPPTRHKIETRLGIDAYDYFGLAEIGPTCASECEEKAGIHWVEDHLLVEIINPETKKRCNPGEVGVLVLTHLTKEATPMLRYWTNDLARLTTEKCGCGRTHARCEGGILGRADDMIIYKGENFYPAQVEKVIRSFDELGDEFRIRITTDEKTGIDVITVVAEYKTKEIDNEEFKNKVKRAFREELQVTPGLELVEFGTLERTMFKAKRVEDQRAKAS